MFIFKVSLLILIFAQDVCCLARKHVDSPLYGKRFVLAAPRMSHQDSEVVLIMYSNSENPITVILSMPWFVDETPQYSYIQINRLQIATQAMSKKYSPTVDIGFTWTFRLSGSDDFGVTVLLVYSPESIATFQVVPVISWGTQYYAVTLSPSPFVEIFSYQSHNYIDITIRATGDYELTFQESKYKNGDTLRILLNNTEAFILSYCEYTSEFSGALTGTNIVGSESIGVLSGTCTGSTKATPCNSLNSTSNLSSSDDMVAEMLTPSSMYGRKFIDLIILDRKTNGLLVVVAGENDTTVSFGSTKTSTRLTRHLPNAGDYTTIYNNGMPRYFTSDKPIMAVYLQSSACLQKFGTAVEMGDVTMSILVPMELFYDSYVWATPRSDLIKPINYVAVVSRRDTLPDLRLDFEQIRNFKHGQRVESMEDWCVSNHHVPHGVHMLTAVTTFTFGCYVYGLDTGYAYMHSAGFLPSPINQPCKRTETASGDLIDNDCDGVVDEEIADRIDNDNDDLVDEDLKKLGNLINGSWTEWSDWACTWNCSDSRVMRKRYCTSPEPEMDGYSCDGDNKEYNESNCHESRALCGDSEEELYNQYKEPVITYEWSNWYCSRNCSDTRLYQRRKCRLNIHCRNEREKSGKCYIKTTCPSACKEGEWGVNCLQSCINCADACDKFNGSCAACMDGYEFPSTACNKPCDPFYYGASCQHSCKERCAGEDCLERQQGKCPQGPYLYLAFIPVAVTVPVVTCLYLRKRRAESPKRSDDKDQFLEEQKEEPAKEGNEDKPTVAKAQKISPNESEIL